MGVLNMLIPTSHPCLMQFDESLHYMDGAHNDPLYSVKHLFQDYPNTYYQLFFNIYYTIAQAELHSNCQKECLLLTSQNKPFPEILILFSHPDHQNRFVSASFIRSLRSIWYVQEIERYISVPMFRYQCTSKDDITVFIPQNSTNYPCIMIIHDC